MKFPVSILSEGQPKSVQYAERTKLCVVKAGILPWKAAFSRDVKQFSFRDTDDKQIISIPLTNNAEMIR